MYQPPLYRRILPWLYVALFAILAPFVLFYTEGYRYNTKKHEVERNGTLIVDSTPAGARVLLDGNDTGETTPITFQNIIPGWHRLALNKTGYSPWEKSLDVRAERVAFANTVWLWKQGKPTLVEQIDIQSMTSDVKQDRLALLVNRGDKTALAFWSPGTGFSNEAMLESITSSTHPSLRFRDDGDALLINGLDSTAPSAWAAWSPTEPVVRTLPSGSYYWSGNDLLGRTEGDKTSMLRVQISSNRTTRELLPDNASEADGHLKLQKVTSTKTTTLTDGTFLTHALALPSGNWSLADLRRPYVLLHDGNRWLVAQPQDNPPTIEQFTGDEPRFLNATTKSPALFLDGTEAWTFTPGSDPSLLWRQSSPLVDVAWHRSGETVFLADSQHIFALELDDRDGRKVTPLADFEEIRDFAVVDKIIYVAGKKDGAEGLWELGVE